ncbi:MAG: hypothetical protein A2031_03410 [Deltaproteobacteria bacterium RBG_19FT_COMBO_43_11]|nr:MAG: hypothetical protein A2031_03410 [Deltaproteobacteria bacterium RBG_19FT_COMBO_43_11]
MTTNILAKHNLISLFLVSHKCMILYKIMKDRDLFLADTASICAAIIIISSVLKVTLFLSIYFYFASNYLKEQK